MRRLLLNYVYYRPVGHAVEALKYAKGFKEANPGMEVHVALNDESPVELTKACSWITKCYPIHLDDFLEKGSGGRSIKRIPREWDFIMTNNLILLDTAHIEKYGQHEEAMMNYLRMCEDYFHARKGEGTVFLKLRLPQGLRYSFDPQVRLNLPRKAIKFAAHYWHRGVKICILLGGSGEYRSYPSTGSWEKIIRALYQAFPHLKMYITGVYASSKGMTDTSAYSKSMVKRVLKSFPHAVNCYDIGLWNQLALIKQSNILISPHTGFGFLASCVGTPWLTLSGGNWPEYFFNHTSFYSVLPDDPDFPYQCKIPVYERMRRIPSMLPEKLEKKIPEIILAVELLLDKRFTYEKALVRHRQNIRNANVKRALVPKGPWF